MKIKLFLLILLSLSIKVGHSQDKKFGFLGGANYAKERGDISDFGNIDWRLAYHLGLLAEFPLSESIVLSPRILYSSQGYIQNIELRISQQFEPLPEEVRVTYRNNYINIPIFIKFFVAEKISLDIAPQLGFLLNSVNEVIEVDNPGVIQVGDREDSSGDFFIDYGLSAGLSYKLNKDFFTQLSYYHGLSNLSRETTFINNTDNNSVFLLSFGYLLF